MQSNCIKGDACEHHPPTRKGDALDHTGTFVGSLCAIHCLICAVAPGVLALVGLSILHSHAAEWFMAALTIGIGVTAAILGYRVHRSGRVVLRFAAACALLVAARVIEGWELHTLGTSVAVMGGLLIVWAHLGNRSFAADARRT